MLVTARVRPGQVWLIGPTTSMCPSLRDGVATGGWGPSERADDGQETWSSSPIPKVKKRVLVLQYSRRFGWMDGGMKRKIISTCAMPFVHSNTLLHASGRSSLYLRVSISRNQYVWRCNGEESIQEPRKLVMVLEEKVLKYQVRLPRYRMQPSSPQYGPPVEQVGRFVALQRPGVTQATFAVLAGSAK
ncbi:hypothetical protein EI94DRAFT_1032877 [Lactarius quietus]|nr:hypothetical protein EI94DRAFT_1032877 [Lactarius quietus]